MKNKILSILFVATLILAVAPLSAFAQQYAAWYNFQCVTFNLESDCAIAESQLEVELMGWDVTPDEYNGTFTPSYDIWFTFRNHDIEDYEVFVIFNIMISKGKSDII